MVQGATYVWFTLKWRIKVSENWDIAKNYSCTKVSENWDIAKNHSCTKVSENWDIAKNYSYIKKPQKVGATVKTIESYEWWENKPQIREYTKIQILCHKPQKRGNREKYRESAKIWNSCHLESHSEAWENEYNNQKQVNKKRTNRSQYQAPKKGIKAKIPRITDVTTIVP